MVIVFFIVWLGLPLALLVVHTYHYLTKEDNMEKTVPVEEGFTNHYGIQVHKDVPITGVYNSHTLCQLISDEYHNAIDLTCNECEQYDIDVCDNCDHSEHTLLIGGWKNINGLWEPDEDAGEYSLLVRGTYTQVVWSKYTARKALCSPCFPGQGDVDTDGDYLTYVIPKDHYDY
jgi:hypothetical protein